MAEGLCINLIREFVSFTKQNPFTFLDLIHAHLLTLGCEYTYQLFSGHRTRFQDAQSIAYMALGDAIYRAMVYKQFQEHV
jgi:hypothetical protein